MGESLYNEADEKIGNITDATVSSEGQVTSLIVGAGGFLGVGEHNVAIPFDKIQKTGDKLILAGYTKDQLKELPKYESPEAKRRASEARSASPLSGSTSNSGALGTPRTTPGTSAPGAGTGSGSGMTN